MDFFGLEVKPGKAVSYVVESGKTLRITQASLGESIQTDTRSVLTINVSGQKHVIAILLPGKSEHTVMDLIFEEQKLEFTVTGKNSIHLAGNLMANDDDDEDEDDDEGGLIGGDDDDDDEDDDEENGADDDDDDDDDEDDEDEDEAPPAKQPADSKKRPAPGASPVAVPAAKQQKTTNPPGSLKKEPANPPSAKKDNAAAAKPATPAPVKHEGGAKTPGDAKKPATPAPAKSAPGTPSTPGTPAKPIPADLKDKIRDLLKTAKDGAIKAGDFTREYEKKYGKSYKEVYEGLGYKKLTESLKAIPDVVQIEGDIVKLKAKK